MRNRNLLVISFLSSLAFGYSQDLKKLNIWEKEIVVFEQKDSLQLPELGSIVFVGSSSIRGWRTLDIDYPNMKTLNRGFGGAEIKDINLFFDRVITKYDPNQIVFYTGDNDIASGKKVAQVYREFKTFYKQVALKLPNTEIIFLSIKPSIKRWNLYGDIVKTNKKIKRFAKHSKNLEYVDVANPMLNEKGLPRPELFLGDGLHMTPLGYDLWKTVLTPYLKPTESIENSVIIKK